MNKITKEIANILESQINKDTYEIHNTGFSAQQEEEIAQFVKMFSKNGLLPFPLKMR